VYLNWGENQDAPRGAPRKGAPPPGKRAPPPPLKKKKKKGFLENPKKKNDPPLKKRETKNGVSPAEKKSYVPEIPWSENCAQIALTGCGASAPNGSVNIVAGSGGASTATETYSKRTQPKWERTCLKSES